VYNGFNVLRFANEKRYNIFVSLKQKKNKKKITTRYTLSCFWGKRTVTVTNYFYEITLPTLPIT